MRLLFCFEIYKRGILSAEGMAFSKHVTNYGRTGLPSYNLTIPIDHLGTRCTALWIWAQGTFASIYIFLKIQTYRYILYYGK